MKCVLIDLSGNRYTRLKVIRRAPNKGPGHVMWECLCDCGVTRIVRGGHLKDGTTKSCGCFQKDEMTKRRTTHGMSQIPEFGVWYGILERCSNPKIPNYHRYGGRGISVCERWKKFENFFADMGKRPNNSFQIDRIDNDGNYEPSNCRWVLPMINSRNSSTTKLTEADVAFIRANLKTKKFTQVRMAEIFGVSASHISSINTGRSWAKSGSRSAIRN